MFWANIENIWCRLQKENGFSYFFSREKSTKRARVFLERNLGKENAEKPDAFLAKTEIHIKNAAPGCFSSASKMKFWWDFRLCSTAKVRTRRKKSARHHIWCLLIEYRLFYFFDGTLSLILRSLTRESKSTFGSFPAREKNVYRFPFCDEKLICAVCSH